MILFVRAPEAGQVKTRLARDLGDKRALALYRSFVRTALGAADAWSKASVTRQIWIGFCPEHRRNMVETWLGGAYVYLAQSGADLGQRMARALSTALDSGAKRAVVVGTDIPQIRPDHIEKAFDCLAASDVVLGPSRDGGYWLIGTGQDKFTPELFSSIHWGTSSVFKDTVARCRDRNLTWSQLEILQDVDTLADLRAVAPDRLKP